MRSFGRLALSPTRRCLRGGFGVVTHAFAHLEGGAAQEGKGIRRPPRGVLYPFPPLRKRRARACCCWSVALRPSVNPKNRSNLLIKRGFDGRSECIRSSMMMSTRLHCTVKKEGYARSRSRSSGNTSYDWLFCVYQPIKSPYSLTSIELRQKNSSYVLGTALLPVR